MSKEELLLLLRQRLEAASTDPRLARQCLEAFLWPNGPACPHCRKINKATFIPRRQVYQCNACRKQFTVTSGTVLKRTHIPLDYWLRAIIAAQFQEDPVTATFLHEELGISYKSALKMVDRLNQLGFVIAKAFPPPPREKSSLPRGRKKKSKGEPGKQPFDIPGFKF
jgi:transposase-like protein